MRIIGISNKGLKKEINEDCYLVDNNVLYDSNCDLNDAKVTFICDGVSNSNGANLASNFVCNEIASSYLDLLSKNTSDIASYINCINNKLVKSLKDSHTTIAGVILDDKRVTSINIGDSKVYLLKDKKLDMISVDHTYYEYLKSINDASYINYKNSHIITACMGSKSFTKKGIHVSSFEKNFTKGDCLFICSDGVSDMVSQEKLEYYLSLDEALEVKVDKIEKRISFMGAKDNYTMLVIEF